MTTLFLSDLHLPAVASPLRDSFLAFLRGPGARARAIYLLGDLFEFWLGDDIGVTLYSEEIAALKRLSDSGVSIHLQHGNRDFMIGAEFRRRTGVQLIADETVIVIAGQRTLLSHGDLFCTQDLAYQRWRRFSRSRLAQSVFMSLPARLRARIAGGLRSESHESNQRKSDAIMDVSEQAVLAAFVEYGVTRIIHGHTHRPAQHRYTVDGQNCERIVLADWRADRCGYLALTNHSSS